MVGCHVGAVWEGTCSHCWVNTPTPVLWVLAVLAGTVSSSTSYVVVTNKGYGTAKYHKVCSMQCWTSRQRLADQMLCPSAARLQSRMLPALPALKAQTTWLLTQLFLYHVHLCSLQPSTVSNPTSLQAVQLNRKIISESDFLAMLAPGSSRKRQHSAHKHDTLQVQPPALGQLPPQGAAGQQPAAPSQPPPATPQPPTPAAHQTGVQEDRRFKS